MMSRRLLSASALVAACAMLAAQAHGKPKVVQVTVRVDSQAPGYEGSRAFDGNRATMWHTRWEFGETKHPHEMTIDLGTSFELSGFAYLPRQGGGNGTIGDYEVYVGDNPKKLGKPVAKGAFAQRDAENVVQFPAKVKGRYVRIRALSEVSGKPWTSIAELRLLADGVVFRAKRSSEAAAPGPEWQKMDELTRQFAMLQQDIRRRGHFQRWASEVLRQEARVLDTDRDPTDIVLRRTAALLADLQRMPDAPDLAALAKELTALQAEAVATDVQDKEARLALHKKACLLRRRIAFSNPLLSFDRILFVKHHRAIYNHMCDQYYGITARPGGGVYILHDPFGAEPKVQDVLADSVVERGRLKGKKLTGGPPRGSNASYNGGGRRSGPPAEGGSFLSPDLSYDGKTIVFAFVECQGDPNHRRHTDAAKGHWHEGWCWHIFKVNVDGSGLEQLTDGTWNDFAPCWLPNGRVAFISERRGGYLRCGRVYDMKPDGSDMRCLSPHETNEWHPSVTNDGRIIYTRWDYIDRHGCTAHLPWITTLDGRDSRAVHGNFAPRNTRPDMEVNIRAIPGSRKFVATAAPHHGQAYGSLVLIDPDVEDNDAMAPVKRITPEVAFPESQRGAQVYGTAWPLSETYYLCVYDAAMAPGAGRQGRRHVPGNYGIYLVDAFGNRELLYRDPDIACLSPIPLRPRPMPPVEPDEYEWHRTTTAAPQLAHEGKEGEAVLAVINVYDSLKPWPEGTQVKALRIFHVLPMSAPSGPRPHETAVRQPESRDSVVPCRHVLGTVPVEKDGSAHFVAPANRELFFQALDERGLAIQSMRSATYALPGERLVCQGCHERRHHAPQMPKSVPLALRRGPSRPKPDVEGSNPFSYPQLVQPVLERRCVPCHVKNRDKKAPNLAREPIKRQWYASYNSLIPYSFHAYGNGYRTTPGQFGARASKLFAMLEKGHHDLKLSPEELHRITLWLDSCSMFYGVYEREGGQAQLQGKVAEATLK